MSKLLIHFIIFVIFSILLQVYGQNNSFPHLKLVLVDKTNISNLIRFTLDNATQIPNDRHYNSILKTVIYSFGWTENVTFPSVRAIINAYAKSKVYNLIIVDYGAYSAADYGTVIQSIKTIGALVGKKLWEIFNTKLAISFELVGHSLGGHLSAYINRAIASSSSNKNHIKIRRIIALDPAGPFFFPANYSALNQPLNSSDAKIVLVIHTDMLYFGAPIKIGTIDVYPNGGMNQPGCPPLKFDDPFNITNFCSHSRSWEYFTEALLNSPPNEYFSVKCQSWDKFKNQTCPYLPWNINRMGMDVNEIVSGDFYLQTNSTSPYSLGFKGLLYNKANK